MVENGIYRPHPNLPVVYVGGVPVLTGKPRMSAQEVLDGLQTAMMDDYAGNDPKKLGLSKKRAMEISLADKAAEGDLAAIGMILDRTLGKPVQQVQNLNVSTGLKDFLNNIIKPQVMPDEEPLPF